MITVGDGAILLGAGVLAGFVGSAGGITSLVSYPALIAVGLPPLSANIANIVALVGCWPGAAIASGPELEGRRRWLIRWAPLAGIGGVAGAALLLLSTAATFAKVVPFLVAGASLALLLEPRISRRRRERAIRNHGLTFPAGLLTFSLYNGYFGAGSGIMILTLLLLLVDRRLPRANALKNMLLGATTLCSAAILALSGGVVWSAAAPLGLGMFAGATIGPRATRLLPASVLRPVIALLGLGLAVELWLHPTF